MFELFYIGLYEWEGPNRGSVMFFDVMDAPRKRGVPSRVVELDDVIRRIVATYGLRNRIYIPWEEDLAAATMPELSAPPEDVENADAPEGESGEQSEAD